MSDLPTLFRWIGRYPRYGRFYKPFIQRHNAIASFIAMTAWLPFFAI
jgi:hypothetical protein